MSTSRKIRIGTRRSRLALVQTEIIIAALRGACPGREFETVRITTSGDRISAAGEALPPGRGIFTREIELALLEERIDLAVHSMKDLPTELPDGLCIGAVPPRAKPNDALVSRGGALSTLRAGALVGTGSPRRAAQVLAARPDLAVADMRGNVDTRLRKLDEGRYDAILLACAGLERLGLGGRITEVLPPEVMLPAVGQGALAVEIKSGAAEIAELLGGINDRVTASCVAAERSLLRTMGGGCGNPIAALAEALPNGGIRLRAMAASADGKTLHKAECSGGMDDAEGLGREAADRLATK